MTRLRLILPFVVLLALPLSAQSRRHAATRPAVDVSTEAGWLAQTAVPLFGAEAGIGDADLEPLRAHLGGAKLIGIGDATHGTREFYTMKLRLIEFLVTKMGFDTIAIEAPVHSFQRVNDYVLDGTGGSAREVLLQRSLDPYFFWQTAELAQVVEWVRAYNLTRGERPAVQFLGIDVYDYQPSVVDIVSYLRAVDSATADEAAAAYDCIVQSRYNDACRASARAFRATLASKEEELVRRSSSRRYLDALLAAQNVELGINSEAEFLAWRNEVMARNAAWIRERRSAVGKLILWMHQEHLGKTPTMVERGGRTTGMTLNERLGADYYVIAQATWEGSFMQIRTTPIGQNLVSELVEASFHPAGDDAYERFFRAANQSHLFIPLRGVGLHPWLRDPHHIRGAGSNAPKGWENWDFEEDLDAKYDAVIFIERTTPVTMLTK